MSSRVTNLLTEAIPSTAIELLPDYEAELGLASTGSNEERQARIVAQRRAGCLGRAEPALLLAGVEVGFCPVNITRH